METEKIWKKIKNAIFNDGNQIEHIDMSYRSFINLIKKLEDTARNEGFDAVFYDN